MSYIKNFVVFFILLGSVLFLVGALIALFTAKFATSLIFLALASVYLYAGVKADDVRV